MKTLHDAIFSPWMPLDPVSVLLRRKFRGGGGSGAYYTLTGTLPLTLPHSLAAAIRSLVRTGSMTQSPAPTPDAPVYPVINNGTVRMVDPDLPAGYKRLKGITFDGNFHYRTGEYLTGDDVVTMTLDNLSTSGKNVFGSYNGANGKNFSLYIYGSSTSGSYFRFGDVLKRPVYGGTGRRTITFGAGGTSGFADDVSIDPDEFTTPANTYIGMLPNSSSAAYTGDIVGNILVGTRLEWIPCESDGGVIGYYERVNGNFIAPTGSGTPVSLGYDNSHLVPRVVGDTEVLTVDAQTATVPDLFAVGDYADEVDVVAGTVTRRVGMKVLTGEESVGLVSAATYYGYIPVDDPRMARGTRNQAVSTHFVWVEGTHPERTLGSVWCGWYGNGQRLYITPTDQTLNTGEKIKAWLAAQYTAGTPVIIWYPLAEPVTESITPQALRTVDGTTVVSSSAGSVGASVEYKASEDPSAANAPAAEPTNAPTEEGV